MKEFDIVKLVNNYENYESKNLNKNSYGIVIEMNQETSSVLFFNESNHRDYAIIEVKNSDLKKESEEIPAKYKHELIKKIKTVNTNSKSTLNKLPFKAYDFVQLIVEDDKYTKYGIHKNMTGTIMEEYAVQNYILVDFSGIDDDGNYYGDCISVNIEDLKLVEK